MPSSSRELSISTLNRLIRTLDFDEFFQLSAQEAAKLLDADGVALIECDDHDQLHYRFFYGLPTHYQSLFTDYKFPSDGGTAGQALQTGQIIFNPDYAHAPHAATEFVTAGLLANLLIPLGNDTNKLGVLAISWFNHRPQNSPDPTVLASIQLLANMMLHKLHHQKMELQLTQQAHHDVLTGLPNRMGVESHINKALALSRKNSSITAVVMLDLDDFKPINDNYGHAAGDAVLIQLAHRITNALRADDYVVRLGGDEFLLVLPDLPNTFTLETLLARLATALSPAYTLINNKTVSCIASMGVTIFPQDNNTADSLIRHADRALYDAKQQKQDRSQAWVYYIPKPHKTKDQRSTDLIAHLDQGLILHYQPIIDTLHKKLVRLEILARLNYQDNLLYPHEFLPTFGTLAYTKLFYAALNKALAQCQLWAEIYFHPAISININTLLLQEAGTPEKIQTALQQHNIPAHQLTLEILEQEQTLHQENTINILNQLHQLGIRLAIDDFATACFSLMQLRKLPIDEIKLDQAFVSTLALQADDLPFALAINQLAHGLGVALIAKGVETAEIAAILSQLGIHLMQGYDICHPVPADDLPAQLALSLAKLH